MYYRAPVQLKWKSKTQCVHNKILPIILILSRDSLPCWQGVLNSRNKSLLIRWRESKFHFCHFVVYINFASHCFLWPYLTPYSYILSGLNIDVGFPSVCCEYHWLIREQSWACAGQSRAREGKLNWMLEEGRSHEKTCSPAGDRHRNLTW